MGNVSSSLTAGFGSQWGHVGEKEVGLLVVVHSEDGLFEVIGP